MTKRVPYSRKPDDLLNPGNASNFFDPDFGPITSDAAMCSEMVRLAYVRHEDVNGRPRLEGFLRQAGFQLGACFDKEGTQGFVASRNGGDDPVTIVAFRGTEPGRLVDVLRDIDIRPSSATGGGHVHTGFAKALAVVHDEFLAAVGQARDRLILTGHSLGAAIALLAASLVPQEQRARTKLFTYGCPRAVDDEAAASLAWLSHARYAGACDLVSWVPPRVLFRYVHHGTLHCIDRDGTSHEFGDGEQGHKDAKTLRGPCGLTATTLPLLFQRLLAKELPLDQLSDHAPINYTSAIWGLR